MTAIIMLMTSLGLGVAHGFDPDHVMVITDYASKNPGSRKALQFGLRFGLGHSLAVLVFSTIALTFKLMIPQSVTTLLESLAGIILILLGFKLLWSIISNWWHHKKDELHQHEHQHGAVEHKHFHKHSFKHQHQHNLDQKTITLIGVLTGLGGTASVMLFGPVLLAPNLAWAILFISVYGIGVILSMSIYGFLLTKFYGVLEKSTAIMKIVKGVTGVFSIMVGVFLLFELI